MNWFDFDFNSFLLVFVILNIVNVVIQTAKSIITINGGKWIASVVNALAYGLYTIVVVYMTADGLGLFWKAMIIGAANLIGVYVVKLIEEKSRKDKLWKVEATVWQHDTESLHKDLDIANIPHNYIDNVGKYTLFNVYCETQVQSAKAKAILDMYSAKYFVSESKTL
jgi:uncharacterized protein YebE (UPF0316 family)